MKVSYENCSVFEECRNQRAACRYISVITTKADNAHFAWWKRFTNRAPNCCKTSFFPFTLHEPGPFDPLKVVSACDSATNVVKNNHQTLILLQPAFLARP